MSKITEIRATQAKAMHEIISSLNNENAYASWIYLMPDSPTEEDFQDFGENPEMFNELCNKFANLLGIYLCDGIYMMNKLYTPMNIHTGKSKNLTSIDLKEHDAKLKASTIKQFKEKLKDIYNFTNLELEELDELADQLIKTHK